MICWFDRLESPIGGLTIVECSDEIVAIKRNSDWLRSVRLGFLEHTPIAPTLLDASRQLGEYFAVEPQGLELDLDFVGVGFHRIVWTACHRCPGPQRVGVRDPIERLGLCHWRRSLRVLNAMGKPTPNYQKPSKALSDV